LCRIAALEFRYGDPAFYKKGSGIISNDDGQPKRGMLSADQKLATAWLATNSRVGIAFKPYLVEFKGGTAISFYKDGKVQSGTLAAEQHLVKSVESNSGNPAYEKIRAGTVVRFDKDGFVLDY
jgi:hypothetical protein